MFNKVKTLVSGTNADLAHVPIRAKHNFNRLLLDVVKSCTSTAVQYLIMQLSGAVFFHHCTSTNSAGSTDVSYLNGKLRCVAAYNLTSPRVAVASKLWECDEPSGRRNCIRAMSLKKKSDAYDS